jgi:hypothetical protein
LISGTSPAAPPTPPTDDGNNPFFRPQPVAPVVAPKDERAPPSPNPPAVSKSPAPPAVKTSYHTAPGDSEDEWGQEKDEGDDSSEDELDSSRDTRDKLARQLFSSILPPASVPPRPQSAAAGAGASATPTASTPTALSAPTPPPPPPYAPIPPPPPPAQSVPAAPPVSSPTPAGGHNALLSAIQSGARLRKAATNDRSAYAFSGRVLGDGAPPHIGATPSLPAERSHSENNVEPSRQSVDWYMGLAADHGTHSSREPSLPSMGEEVEEQARKEVNGHAAPAPDIRVAPAEEIESDPLEDIDRSAGLSSLRFLLLAFSLLAIAEYRVRTLYPYDCQRAEDLCSSSFRPPTCYLLTL